MSIIVDSFADIVNSFRKLGFSGLFEMIKEQPLWILVGLMWIVVCVGVFVSIYNLIMYMKKYSIIHSLLNKFYISTMGSERKRMLEEYRMALEVGARDKRPWISKFDHLVIGSGIEKRIKFANSETILITMGLGAIIMYIMVSAITKSSLFAGIAGFLVIMGIYTGLYAASRVRHRKVENELIAFTNITDNFSRASDDLVDILDRSSWYIEEPIKSALRECVNYSRYTGDLGTAIERMKVSVQHQKFRELIRNLEVASKYEANYSEIITDNRKMLTDYLRDKKERDAIYANGKVEIVTVIAICCFALWLVSDITSESIPKMITGSAFGAGLVIYLLGVTVYTIKTLFFDDTRME